MHSFSKNDLIHMCKMMNWHLFQGPIVFHVKPKGGFLETTIDHGKLKFYI